MIETNKLGAIQQICDLYGLGALLGPWISINLHIIYLGFALLRITSDDRLTQGQNINRLKFIQINCLRDDWLPKNW